ncbi:hypothetical protein Kpol_1013p40 [Vanderwaltozyma polyspora DSM 70294]|uniref:DNA polymerase epsilon subunit B n=1 Tax=Vanderwaltozyma polyspora (strain ATCC 22028 / DSM 70294 / BCRC 21397 / CBS 2163 / NBRC 10782 / NRRL Y-8283 / UCD 57-17) TaxID=436907 RepID=A7TH87_VANPO|nr:uncharacterized protein Kpol_1013p40 [Vanderwaltozyma polyspora DSM 70294]EDO18368.1 hypothetical protein Kpol_1013p40 [Vanderwaltozyma polyspora DSM 70294]
MLGSGNVLPVKIQPPLLRPLAYRILSKKYGLNIKSDGLVALAEFIGGAFGIEWKKSGDTILFLERFATIWKQQERGIFIDANGVNEVISELKEREKTTIKKKSVEERKSGNGGVKTLDSFLLQKASTPLDEAEDSEVAMEPKDKNTMDLEDDESRASSTSPVVLETDEVTEDEMEVENVQEEEENEDEDGDVELDWRNYFKVINASEQQRFSYDPYKLQFVFQPSFRKANLAQNSYNNNNNSTRLQSLNQLRLPDVDSKISIFPTRYNLIRDRIMRNEAFQNDTNFNPLSSMISMKNAMNSNENSIASGMSLTLIKNLLGRNGKNFLLLGLIKKNSKGKWALEDTSGVVEIDLTQAIPTSGVYYVPGCIVLVEGIYFTSANTFHVSSITHPPAEKREITLEAIGNIDLLGVHGISTPNYIAKLDSNLKLRLHFLEKELIDHKFLILGGDLFLDDMNTISALRKLFTKINDDPPTVIIFQGSFSSTPVHASTQNNGISSTSRYKNGFDTLATLLSQFDYLTESSTMIFIPGANDPWSSMVSLGATRIWPQKSIPNYFTQRINRVCKNVIWGSNPTRIAYLAQEIVITRDDIAERFKRNSIYLPAVEEAKKEELLIQQEKERERLINDPDNIQLETLSIEQNKLPAKVKESRKIVKTILDQGHLSPFLTSIKPVMWDLDHALTLYPIPSTLIVTDLSAPPYEVTYNGCKVLNPGIFINNRRARYLEYCPALKKATQEELYF